MEKVSATQFANNAMWKLMDIFARKMISMVISIILARLIAPEAYGVIALTIVFITFSDIFLLNGFNIALIRKESTDEIDYSTVMCMSLAFSTVLYAVIFLAAPYVALFYDSPKLKSVLRVITILLFFQAVTTVIRAKGTRELAFKKMSISTFISNISAGVIGVILACFDFGVWALVAQQVLANLFDMIVMMIMFRWHFSLRFSSMVARQLSRFTFGVLSTSFLDFLGNNVCSLVVGKSYSTVDLGYYNRGNMFPETIGLNTFNAINSVLLPAMASRQNDAEDLKRVTRRVMSLTEYIIFPMMFGLIGVSDVLVPLLLTEKWIPSISLMNFFCIIYAVNPIRTIGYNVFYAKGESKITVRIEIMRALLMIANLLVIVVLLKKPILWMLAGNAVISIIVAMVTQFLVKQSIGYSFMELLTDILPALIMSILVMLIARAIGFLNIGRLPLLILQMSAGAGFYVLASIIMNNRNFRLVLDYVLSTVKNVMKKRRIHQRCMNE